LPGSVGMATIGTTMTSHLYIIRHAVAEDVAADGTDGSRRLTPKGRRRFSRLARRLVRCGIDVDLIATSPLVRTRETADLLAAVLPNQPPVAVVEALAPGSNWHAIAAWTQAQPARRVAWVGHAPCVGRLVARAIGDGTASVAMDKGAVASISCGDGLEQAGVLEWLAVPDLMRRRK